jgi:hypothetical protein
LDLDVRGSVKSTVLCMHDISKPKEPPCYKDISTGDNPIFLDYFQDKVKLANIKSIAVGIQTNKKDTERRSFEIKALKLIKIKT